MMMVMRMMMTIVFCREGLQVYWKLRELVGDIGPVSDVYLDFVKDLQKVHDVPLVLVVVVVVCCCCGCCYV